MDHPSRAIVLRPRDPPSHRLLTAELRLAGLLREVAALEEDVGALARELAAFEARYVDETGQAFAELDRAERLVRRVRRALEEVARLEHAVRSAPPPGVRERRTAGARELPSRAGEAAARTARAALPPAPASSGAAEGAAPAALELKALHRLLARMLHPDLARGSEADRARRCDLMARANEAYERRDRAALELLAERAGALGCEGGLPEPERLAHLGRRIASVEAARARLAAERARLAGSGAARLRAEVPRRAASGGDLFAETRAAAEAEARAARAEALHLLSALPARILALHRARREGPLAQSAKGRGGKSRDPVAASPLLRRRPARSAHGRAAAHRLAMALERQARSAPWQVALTLLAFLFESAGVAPEALGSWDLLAERWEALRAAWPASPDLPGALARLPPHLEIGLRWCGDDVQAGLQLASPELVEGVRVAFAKEPVRDLAQRLLAALGPVERCACAGEIYAVHVLRLRGPDEVHGLACPRCGRVLKSFWRYGEPRGLEVLGAVAVEIGLVVEQPVRLAGAPLTFQMLPAERNRLTARALVRRFRELCLAPHGLELPRGALAIRAGRALLADGARVPEGVRVALVAVKRVAGIRERDLLTLVREKVVRRFRA